MAPSASSRAGKCRYRDIPTPLTRNFVARRNSGDGKMASEQRDKTCAVALDPAGELKLEQDRSHYAG